MAHSIAQTSDCVLAMAGHESYKESSTAQEYLSKIDFSDAKKQLEKYLKIYPHYPEIILNRKYIIQKVLFSFFKKNQNAQLLILGSGLDPLGFLVKDKFPEIKVFEIEKISVMDKKEIINSIKDAPKIHICEADLSNPIETEQALKEKGYRWDLPTIIVAEGISYYIEKESFWNTVKRILPKTSVGQLVLEHMIPQEKIAEENRSAATEIFENLRKDYNIDSYFTYDDTELKEAGTKLGLSPLKAWSLKDIEMERTGKNEFFLKENSFCFYITTWLQK